MELIEIREFLQGKEFYSPSNGCKVHVEDGNAYDESDEWIPADFVHGVDSNEFWRTLYHEYMN